MSIACRWGGEAIDWAMEERNDIMIRFSGGGLILIKARLAYGERTENPCGRRHQGFSYRVNDK
jgi:hypothetical protein